jgi:hypothetical protein
MATPEMLTIRVTSLIIPAWGRIESRNPHGNVVGVPCWHVTSFNILQLEEHCFYSVVYLLKKFINQSISLFDIHFISISIYSF